MSEKKTARSLPLLLALGLCLAYGLWLLAWAAGFSGSARQPAPDRTPTRALTMVGADQGGPPSELLPGQRLDLNRATAEELRLLPGIGEKLSQAIVEYREQNGPFDNVDALTRVPGIGEKKLEAVRALVYVDPAEPGVSDGSD